MTTSNGKLRAPLRVVEPESTMAGHRVGWVVGREDGALWIDYPDNPHGPLPARSTVALSRARIAALAKRRGQVLLAFDAQRSSQPLVVGVIQDATTDADDTFSIERNRIELVGREEVILRCGSTTIRLHKSGRVSICGDNIVTRASGTNRILGGRIELN